MPKKKKGSSAGQLSNLEQKAWYYENMTAAYRQAYAELYTSVANFAADWKTYGEEIPFGTVNIRVGELEESRRCIEERLAYQKDKVNNG